MSLTQDEIDNLLENFAISFVSFFEDALSNYYRNLVDNIPKAGKWAELVNWTLRMTSSATMLGAASVSCGTSVGTALALPLLSVVISDVGAAYNKRKMINLLNILEIYQKSKENKIKIRENLIEAAITIFKSFELKFKQATLHGSYELAILKLARDAVDRVFNFFNKNSLVFVVEEDFFRALRSTKAIILGKSKRHKGIFAFPNRYLGYSLDNNITTTQLYEETPVLKIIFQHKNVCYRPINSRVISDFRLILDWEGEKIVGPTRWGIDDDIVLYENRKFRKLISSNPENLINLTIAQLSTEELEEKKQTILTKLSYRNGALERILKKELKEMRMSIKDDVVSEISKLERNTTDLKNIIIPTLEELALSLSKGNDDLKEKIDYLKERKFTTMEENLFLDRCFKKLKTHLLIQEDVNTQDLYISQEGYYNLLSDRFPLLAKVISFVQSPEKRILFILGESGAGKSRFTVHFTQFLLGSRILSQNFRILPLYIPLVRSELKKSEAPVIETLLSYYYSFNEQEIEFLLYSRQFLICLILDDIDQLEDNFIKDFYKSLPDSYYIFTASLSKFKSAQDCEALFFPEGSHEKQIFKFLQEKTIKLAPFNKKAKNEYISKFLNKEGALKFSQEQVEAIYQRMKGIPYLNESISQPLLLMMTMEVFPYLEMYYKESVPHFEEVQKTLFHMYTHLIYTRMANEIKEKKGIIDVNGISIYNCILKYSINLAQLMQEKNVIEITEDTLEFKKFFTKKYSAALFKDGYDFKAFKYGYQGCAFIHSCGTLGNMRYRFTHDKFYNYFRTLPNDNNKQQRIDIQVFMDKSNPFSLIQSKKYLDSLPTISSRIKKETLEEDLSLSQKSTISSIQEVRRNFFSSMGGTSLTSVLIYESSTIESSMGEPSTGYN